MALSGSFNTSSIGAIVQPQCPHYVTVSWTATQDESSNTTTVTWTAKAENTGYGGYYTTTNGVITATYTNGSTTKTVTLLNYSRKNMYAGTTIGSGSFVINHASDGSASLKISASFAMYYTTTNVSGSGSWTITKTNRGVVKIRTSNGWEDYIPYIRTEDGWVRHIPYIRTADGWGIY